MTINFVISNLKLYSYKIHFIYETKKNKNATKKIYLLAIERERENG